MVWKTCHYGSSFLQANGYLKKNYSRTLADLLGDP
jgi:hypothetical protein